MTTKLKRQVDLDIPVKSDKWINVIVLKNGKSINGSVIYPSEDAAKKRSVLAEILNQNRSGYNTPNQFHWADYAYSIQMPITEEK